MKYEDLLNDLMKLQDIKLHSIRPGADITVMGIDLEQQRILIKNSSGNINSRSLKQIKMIWDRLMTEPAVHVEQVLHGSTSSRNQPETVLANLPYIEWLKINGKKHIVYTGEFTHAYGTLKEVDAYEAIKIIESYQKHNEINILLNVVEDIREATDNFSTTFGIQAQAIKDGIYAFNTSNGRVIFSSSLKTKLPCGHYIFLDICHKCDDFYEILGSNYGVMSLNGVNYLCERFRD